MSDKKQTYCGYIAIVGRPNVGKSTLLNRILQQKISITSRKPQTTRHRIVGIKMVDNAQMVYVDTPGIHQQEKTALNKMMNKAADSAIHDVDAVIFMIDAMHWREDDDWVLNKIKNCKVPVYLVINKVDQIKDKQDLLPYIEQMQLKMDFAAIFPISAKQGDNVESLEQTLITHMPESPWLFYEDQITDRSERFMIAEIVREKLFRESGDELPYATTVEIEQFKLIDKVYHISALIMVEKESHKRMFIGKSGSKLKIIGKKARLDIEKLLGKKVFLRLWIKVKSGWSDDERALRSLGYD